MAIDGLFVRHLTSELHDTLVSGRINKVSLISENDLLLNVRRGQNYNLFLSSNANYARVNITNNNYEKPVEAPTLTIVLRKYIEGGIIKDIYQYRNDRIIIFIIEKYNEIGEKKEYKMISEIMGKHSNIILVDDEGKIIDAIKRVPPFQNRFRTILPKAEYIYPVSDKLNPFSEEVSLDSLEQIEGLSKQSLNEISYTNSLDLIYKGVTKPTLYKGDKESFYFTDLVSVEGERVYFDSLSELLDNYYYAKDTKDRFKAVSNDLSIFLHNHIKKLDKKIDKFVNQLEDVTNADKYQLYGELLLIVPNLNLKGEKKIVVNNYYTNTDQEIILDPKLSILENSNKYYQKAKKIKSSVSYINEQLAITKQELVYFKDLLDQLSYASPSDIEEIKDELVEKRYLKKNSKKNNRKKNKPSFLTYKLNDDIIYVGKNNLQNAYLTHKFASSNDMWFHVKDSGGSHVILKAKELNEDNIRASANLAALYSKYKDSSSVQIDYTLVKNIKKVPGMPGSFVTYTNQQSIYIDPDFENIKHLKLIK